jgi:hypothetical protein
VITFNTLVASQAATDYLLMLVGLTEDSAPSGYLRFFPRPEPVKSNETVGRRF